MTGTIQIAPEGDPQDVEIGTGRAVPAVLPVLPLRETVPLPDTLTPLAVGQDRSVRLINDVLAGDRLLCMVASRNPELDAPGP
ncbi:MAG TPA: LON peptidase substrate-binding domain-containing protein, partial [Baekduia sp.]|nr:LON peptidase substrate-binding domain-containing protein [Baekduia sp.]